MRILFSLASALLAAPLCVGRAQEPRRLEQPDSIPFELARDLLAAGWFGGEPQILVGSAPAWVDRLLYVPNGGHVLGSAFLGQSVVAIVQVPPGADTSTTTLKSEFLRRGWSVPPIPTYGGGGFRPASSLMISSHTFCADQHVLNAYTRQHAGTDVFLVEHISTSQGYSVCHPPQPPQPMLRSPFPMLIEPPIAPGLPSTSDCRVGGTSNSMGTGATIRAAMSPRELLDYFGRQLADSGWQSMAPAGSTVIGRWAIADIVGTHREVTLTVTPSQNDVDCVQAYMEVRLFKKP